MSKGCVEFHGFTGHPSLTFRTQNINRAHVVQAVGKLDQDNPYIIYKGEKQLAVILGLCDFTACENITDFSSAINDGCNFRAELRLDVLQRKHGVFDNIVEQRCHNTNIIKRDFPDDDERNLKGVGIIRFARHTQVVNVCIYAEAEGFFDSRAVKLWQ
ncbi:MAG: hypothetical protein UZ06_CHB003001659 [Chlorobi bacterium OLB6]|nr:MAG: hypothetical protein UZ06_CHB003001659 [Chlorobi bacterium OLB6]